MKKVLAWLVLIVGGGTLVSGLGYAIYDTGGKILILVGGAIALCALFSAVLWAVDTIWD